MGKVYQAEDLKLHRIVALKVMLPAISDALAARERFLRKARSMAAVRNDHVVTIYEVSQADDVPYLAMEFLHGQTLEGHLKDGAALKLNEIARIGREIATGLAAAQRCGLIHRDIKPANLWLEAPTGRVKILDFGLARPVHGNSGLTVQGDLVGTPSYMSPEQARGSRSMAAATCSVWGWCSIGYARGNCRFKANPSRPCLRHWRWINLCQSATSIRTFRRHWPISSCNSWRKTRASVRSPRRW